VNPLRTVLIRASDSPRLRRQAAERRRIRDLVARFVAGETLDEGLAVAARLNEQGRSVTLDYLGESVTDAGEARAAAKAYLEALGRVGEQGLDCGVSVKPTQMGLHTSANLCRELLADIVAAAEPVGAHVTLDMEGSDVTEATVALVEHLHAEGHREVGCAIQAYLHRSPADLERLSQVGASLRLCKGAYAEPADIAVQRRKAVDRAYAEQMAYLLEHGTHPRLATHDDKLIDQAKTLAVRLGLGKDAFEFQMLYGVRPTLQDALVRDGWRLRVYVPFGTEWYPYFTRRLAERPANLVFFLRALRDT
jgi:proline dehydrogenase